MYRHLAAQATRRALLQYFDLLEPIMPPPTAPLYLEDATDVYIMQPQLQSKEQAHVHIDLTRLVATVNIPVKTLHAFFPEDMDALREEATHQLIKHPKFLPPHYQLPVNIEDIDNPPSADDIFLRKVRTPSTARRPPSIPTRAHHTRRLRHK
jgi:hypothetical protein